MFVGDLPNDRLSAALAKAGKQGGAGGGGGAGGAGRYGASALLLAVLVLVPAMVAGGQTRRAASGAGIATRGNRGQTKLQPPTPRLKGGSNPRNVCKNCIP